MASEFIEEWNKVQPLHIKESDLKNPTESFVRKCVCLLMRQMLVKLDFMENIDFDCKDARARAARIRLVYIVNHFYFRASPGEKQVNFFLMDLLKPNYRKTYMVLRNLLNYLLYQRMVKTSTIDVVDDKIAARDALLIERNRLKKEIEHNKINHQNTRRKINENEVLFPKMKVQVNDMGETEVKLKNSLDVLADKIIQLDMKMLEMKPELNELKRLVVTDKEAEAIINAEQEAKAEIEEQDQIMKAARNKLKENNSAIEKLTDIIAKTESVFESLMFDPVELRDLKKNETTMTKDLENLRKGLETDRTKKKILSDQKNALKVGLEECKRNKKKLTKKFSLKDMTLAYKNKEASLESLRVQEQSFIMDERKAKKEAEIILKMVESTSDYLMSV